MPEAGHAAGHPARKPLAPVLAEAGAAATDGNTPPLITPRSKRQRGSTGLRSDNITWRRSPKDPSGSTGPRVDDIEDLGRPQLNQLLEDEEARPPPSNEKDSLLGSWLNKGLPVRRSMDSALAATTSGAAAADPQPPGESTSVLPNEDGLLNLLERLEGPSSASDPAEVHQPVVAVAENRLNSTHTLNNAAVAKVGNEMDEIELACLRAEQESQRRQFLAAAKATAVEQSLDRHQRVGWLSPLSASCAASGVMWQRYKVLDVHVVHSECLDLLLSPRPRPSTVPEAVVVAHLTGVWAQTVVEKGHVVNVVWTHGPPANLAEITVSDFENFCIVHPDFLMSPTKVADANSCMRKSVLQDSASASASSEAMVLGHLLHEIFQQALVGTNGFTSEVLDTFKAEVLAKASNVEKMFGAGLDADSCAAELHGCLSQLEAWGRMMMGPDSKGALVYFGSEEYRVRVLEVIAEEEMIWSPMWGLKGALDATVVIGLSSDTSPARRIIVPLEFKTNATVRAEHMAQVIMYALLVGDRYHGRPAVGQLGMQAGLLVNLSDKDPLPKTTGVKLAHAEVRQLVLLRNSFAIYKANATPKAYRDSLVAPTLLPAVTGNSSGECARCFARNVCVLHHITVESGTVQSCGLEDDDFASIMGGVLPSYQTYFSRWLRMLDSEERCAVSHQREIWTLTGREREDLGRCVSGLRLQQREEGDILVFSRSAPICTHELQMQVGDRVLVSLEGRHIALKEGTLVALSSKVVKVRAILPEVRFAHDDDQGDCSSSSQNRAVWRVDRLELLWGMRLLKSRLVGFVLAQEGSAHAQRLRTLVIDLASPRFWDDGNKSLRDCPSLDLAKLLGTCGSPEEVRHGASRIRSGRLPPARADDGSEMPLVSRMFLALTEDQQRAVALILAARDWCCIMGVPGAGKTTTIAYAVRALHCLGRSVLITAYTHAALDNLLLKLREIGLPVLRLGHAASVHNDLRDCLLSESCTMAELEAHMHDEALIAGATCLGLSSHPLFQRRRFAYCIVDEAGQLTHPVSLAPMQVADVAVLVGDQNQLPPLVVSEEARQLGMGTSLFEDLCKAHPIAVVTLCTQFRMNEELNGLANELIYNGRLRCGSVMVSNRRLHVPHFPGDLPRDSWLYRACDPSRSVMFLDTDNCLAGGAKESRVFETGFDSLDNASSASGGGAGSRQSRDSLLVVNEVEAQIAHVIVDRLGRLGAALGDIGVISPYRAQLRVLRRRIMDAIEVQTVDTFQGRDKACIVVSLVRSNADQAVGTLLLDWRRINVAFTRAKCKLIVIGSRTTLRQSNICAKFLQVCSGKDWICALPRNGHTMFGDPATRFAGKSQ